MSMLSTPWRKLWTSTVSDLGDPGQEQRVSTCDGLGETPRTSTCCMELQMNLGTNGPKLLGSIYQNQGALDYKSLSGPEVPSTR